MKIMAGIVPHPTAYTAFPTYPVLSLTVYLHDDFDVPLSYMDNALTSHENK